MTDFDDRKPEYSFWAEQVDEEDLIRKPYQADENKVGLKTSHKIVIFIGIFLISFLTYEFFIYKKQYNINSNKTKGYEYYDENKLNIDTPSRLEARVNETEPASIITGDQEQINKIIEEVMPSIVSITGKVTTTSNWFGTESYKESEQFGTGILINKDDDELLVVTNNHVVGNADEIEIGFTNDFQANAVLKGVDGVADIAVLSVKIKDLDKDTLELIKIANVGNSSDIKVGQMSIAIGNALGYGQSVTVGYISAKDRKININSLQETKNMILLQTDAAINPGNSGGALVDTNGNVIGINTIKFASNKIEGMGYAIPINRAMPIINEIMSREELKDHERGFLGIVGKDVLDDDTENYGMPLGVYISEVLEGGGAKEAGLLKGDIIVGINDIEIVTISQLKDKVSSVRVGTTIKIKYRRIIDGEYKEQEVLVTLKENIG